MWLGESFLPTERSLSKAESSPDAEPDRANKIGDVSVFPNRDGNFISKSLLSGCSNPSELVEEDARSDGVSKELSS